MIFRQLIETESNTYTYLLGCAETRQAVLIDPVLDTVERDIHVLQFLHLLPHARLGTHLHANYLSGERAS